MVRATEPNLQAFIVGAALFVNDPVRQWIVGRHVPAGPELQCSIAVGDQFNSTAVPYGIDFQVVVGRSVEGGDHSVSVTQNAVGLR